MSSPAPPVSSFACFVTSFSAVHWPPTLVVSVVRLLTAAVKLYAAKVERRGYDVVPFPQHAVTATETVVTACGMIRAADLNMFDVAIWFHRPQGIE